MELKKSAWAGWFLFLSFLFLSVFYILGTGVLSQYTTVAPFYCIALIEIAAFVGTAVVLPSVTHFRLPKKRGFKCSVVYIPLIVYGSLTAGAAVFLVNALLAVFTGTHFAGLTSFYPMVAVGITRNPWSALVLLAIIPAICEETVLRGRILPLLEENGLASAVFVSAVCMPLLYVYPGASTAVLIIGAAAALMAHYTDSLVGALAVHISCRFMLWLGDIISRSEDFENNMVSVNFIALGVLLIFIVFTLRAVEDLITDGLVIKPQRGPDHAAANLWNSMYSIGFMLFILLYIARLVVYFMEYV